MKQLYFFDDFLIRRSKEIKRVFHTPEWMPEHLYIDQTSYYGTGYSSIVPAPNGGYYLYSITLTSKDEDTSTVVALAHSTDGLSWAPVDLKDKAASTGKHHINFGKIIPGSIFVMYDPEDPNPARRYKMTNSPFDPSKSFADRPPCILYDSPDGLVWTPDSDHHLLPSNSDTMLNMIKNPYTGNYQVTLRRRWGERRIYLVESGDLKEWTPPRLIMHPEPTDPAGTHFYGMPQLAYGDMFAGFLWRMKMPYNGIMDGPVTTELTYSYDGYCWNRTHFDFMPLRELGTHGGGSIYGAAMLDAGDKLLVYAMAGLEQHHRVFAAMKAKRYYSGLLPGWIRKEGLVGMAADSGQGEITTELLKLRDPNLTVNINAPFGGVRFQLADEYLKPLEGYTYEDSEEIIGDHLAAPLRWKNRPDLSDAVKQQPLFRLMIRMEQAELFAVHGDFVFTTNPFAPLFDNL